MGAGALRDRKWSPPHGGTIAGAPWPIPAYVASHIPTFAVRDVPDGAIATVLAALALLLLLLAFVWRGSRVAWTILVLVGLSAVVTQPFDPAPWWALALNLVGLVLLLVPTTRAFVWGHATRIGNRKQRAR